VTDRGGFPKVFGNHLPAGWGGNGHLRAQFVKIVSRSPPSVRRRLPPDAGVMKAASDGSGTTVDIAPLRLALSAPPPVGSGVSR
jgi:hypothetical protein